jgi:hypothetical protein
MQYEPMILKRHEPILPEDAYKHSSRMHAPFYCFSSASVLRGKLRIFGAMLSTFVFSARRTSFLHNSCENGFIVL